MRESATLAFVGDVYNLETERGVYVADGMLVHNCQRAAAPTLRLAIDPFLARYRIGVSADERRKDRMEGLTHELFGDIIYDLDPARLEKAGTVIPVDILVYPTEFRADWYHPSENDDEKSSDYNRLLDEISIDADRNELAAKLAAKATGSVFVMVRRRDHGHAIDRLVSAFGEKSGFMFGGDDYADEYDRTRALLESGEVKVATGTIQSIGQGIDVPRVHDVVLAAPAASNRQNFNQARGRACRKWGDDKVGRVHYLWDQHVFSGHLRNLDRWYPGRVFVIEDGGRVPAGAWLSGKRKRERQSEGWLLRR